jgi:hypothetical protein
MTNKVTRAALVAAFDQLRADVLRQGASPVEDTPIKVAMLKALDKMGRQLELDPTWFDDVLNEVNRLIRDDESS